MYMGFDATFSVSALNYIHNFINIESILNACKVCTLIFQITCENIKCKKSNEMMNLSFSITEIIINLNNT